MILIDWNSRRHDFGHGPVWTWRSNETIVVLGTSVVGKVGQRKRVIIPERKRVVVRRRGNNTPAG